MKPSFLTVLGTVIGLLAAGSVIGGSALAQTAPAAAAPAQPTPVAPTSSGPQKDTMGDAVTAPLSDLNLKQDKIPQVLIDIADAPYAPPVDSSCAGLAAAIVPLDEALGEDLDSPPSKTNPGLLERGTVMAGDAAVDAVRGATQGLIPFRGWVRKLTGAEAHARKVRAAIAAGAVRRAYLKGLGEAKGCPTPAAPARQIASR